MDLLHPAAFLLHVFQAEDVNAVTVSFTTSTVMKQLESLRDKVQSAQSSDTTYTRWRTKNIKVYAAGTCGFRY